MQYHSTRNKNITADSTNAVLEGICPDGGLYVPENIPNVDWKEIVNSSVYEMQTKILSAFLPDIPNMKELVNAAYSNKFDDEEITPTAKVGKFHVLELFHGPTYAFKDIALCMLPQLLSKSMEVKNIEKNIKIITATSGDTGKAAMSGFQDVKNIDICVFYPHEGVSKIQKSQMTTQLGKNIKVAGVKGNFDDIQSNVKKIFEDNKTKELPFILSSANSINIGRLAPQIMYYFKSYKTLIEDGTIEMGEKVNYSVPTGNFGDILAAYLAKSIGLPINKLICASNENKILTDFIRTGVYDKNRNLVKTSSPSMDILISSNLERLLYFLTQDAELVAGLMSDLKEKGKYIIPDSLKVKLQDLFWADYCDAENTSETISSVFKEYNYLCDPHTACGWYAAKKYVEDTQDDTPMIVLSTASPYKFPAVVLNALDIEPSDNEFEQMNQLNEISQIDVPNNLANLANMEILHKDVVAVDQMQDFSFGI